MLGYQLSMAMCYRTTSMLLGGSPERTAATYKANPCGEVGYLLSPSRHCPVLSASPQILRHPFLVPDMVRFSLLLSFAVMMCFVSAGSGLSCKVGTPKCCYRYKACLDHCLVCWPPGKCSKWSEPRTRCYCALPPPYPTNPRHDCNFTPV